MKRIHPWVVVMAAVLAQAVVVPAALARPSDRVLKLELVDRLDRMPHALHLGSSTSRDVDPALVRTLTGRRVFNASVSAGSAYDMRRFLRYLDERFAGRQLPQLVWGLDVETFRPRPAVAITRRPAGARPLATYWFTGLGFRRSNPYAGTELAELLPQQIRRYADNYYRSGSYSGLSADHTAWFDDTIRTANARGLVPFVYLGPVHPRHRKVLGPLGWNNRRGDVLAFLGGSAMRGLNFRFADFTDLRTINGETTSFYDGVHLRPANMRRLLVRLDRLEAWSSLRG